MEFDEEIEYTIVGSAEADPSENKISNESHRQEFNGKSKGDEVEITISDGVIKYKILEINKKG